MATPTKPKLKPLSLDEYERLFTLPKEKQRILYATGTALALAAGLLLFYPPTRKSVETLGQDKTPSKTIASEAEATNVVVALVSAGVVLLLFAVNGTKFAKLEVPGLKVETERPSLGEWEDSPSKPKAEVASVGSPASGEHGKPIAGVQNGDNPQHTFLLRSSWHGLKILKACQASVQPKRLLNLREFATVGMPMAYDYAFGFFIAAFSADVVIASADPVSGHVFVVSVHPTVDARINEVLEGYIAAHSGGADELRDDLNALLSYLKAR